jgi:hypothetical protein
LPHWPLRWWIECSSEFIAVPRVCWFGPMHHHDSTRSFGSAIFSAISRISRRHALISSTFSGV